MFCMNCGKELPEEGNFCPYCGATKTVGNETGVNNETMVFKPSDDDEHIDLSAFEAALSQSGRRATPDDIIDAPEPLIPIEEPEPEPQPRPAQGKRIDAPHTTYFQPGQQKPYKKSSAGKKVAVTLILILLLGSAAGAGVWYYINNRPDTSSLEAAEKYMLRGKFDDALNSYLDALADAKDPSSIQLQIDRLRSFEQAEDFIENGDYASALATLGDLQGRITDTGSELYSQVEDMQEIARQGLADGEFAKDLQEAQDYLNDGKYDAAAGKLDSLSGDEELTEEQRNQVENVRAELEKAQSTAQKQETDRQEKAAKKEEFRKAIADLETSDETIANAKTSEEALELTSISFEGWDSLLNEMYDYLATILNADQYAAEEANYKKWQEERDSGANNAKTKSPEEASGNLASVSFKQSYTKTRCYKLLDMM